MMQENRAAMALVTRRARAYFAPVTAQALDLTAFATCPPSGWIDLGWVENVKRTYGPQMEPVRAGTRGIPVAQFRNGMDACVELDFLEWGKPQMALSSGGQSLNVLAPGTALAVSAQSSRTQLCFEAEPLPFIAGELIAVDTDYTGQTGAVGTGVGTAYVKNASDISADADYVRRITLNVARVGAVDGASVSFQQPLPFAVPDGAKAQKVIAVADCEGVPQLPEWSALFVAENESGGRVCWYYPRLQPAAAAQESSIEVATPLEVVALHASFRALPVNQNSPLCYRICFPAASAAAY